MFQLSFRLSFVLRSKKIVGRVFSQFLKKGNAALRYILICSWAKEHKREWFLWKLQEKLVEFTTWNYARFGYLILALKTFSTGPIFKREIAFSSRTRPRVGR